MYALTKIARIIWKKGKKPNFCVFIWILNYHFFKIYAIILKIKSNKNKMEKLSTSKLALKLNVKAKELFQFLQDSELIINEKNTWHLTQKWKENGGVIIKNFKYWDYIAWESDFNPYEKFKVSIIHYVTSTELAEFFSTSSRKINIIISELWFTQKNIKGWILTEMWKMLWWKEISLKSWQIFVKWPESMKENKLLLQEFQKNKTETLDIEMHEVSQKTHDIIDEFRNKFPAKYRTKDWHNVRSRGEVIIDNTLYEYGLVHAYERKLPIDENVYSDFYLPARLGASAVYIEYWGMEDGKYNERKKLKREIYKKYNLNLIELENHHIDNLDDYLPKLLLDFGIRVD
jgi:hypothetical protein